MVKVAKVAAYQIGDRIFTDRGEAERVARREVIAEVLGGSMSFGGIVTPEDVAKVMSDRWDTINQKLKEAFAGIS